MRRALAISFCMPPLLFPRSIQVQRTLAHLPDLGWQPTVICAQPETVRRRQDASLASLYKGSYEQVTIPSPEKSLVLRALFRFFPVLSRLPDKERLWGRRAASVANRLARNQRFEAVLSFSNPVSDHLVGLALKKKTALPWVAHFSDPWVDNPYKKYGRMGGTINRRLERAVVEHADAVIFVCEETRQLVMGKYPPEWRSKAHVISHSFDPALYPKGGASDGKLTFRYIGRFYGLRTPEPLFRAVARLKAEKPDLVKDCVFELIGASPEELDGWSARYNISGEVVVKPEVDYLESLALMKEADVLVLIDAPAEVNVFLPSKLIDYLGAGKSILGITPLEGASARFLRSVGGVVVDPRDVEGIATALANLCEQHAKSALKGAKLSSPVVQSYNVKHTTALLSDILGSLTP